MSSSGRDISVAILGAEKTGKSALVNEYLQHALNVTGHDSQQKHVQIDGQQWTIGITEAHLPYQPLEEANGNIAHAYILLYSIDNPASLQLIRQTYEQVRRAVGSSLLPKTPIFLVANKSDLEIHRQVELEEGRQLAIQLHCQKLFEISCKTQSAEITDIFEKLVREYTRMQNTSSTPQRPPLTPNPQGSEPTSPSAESPGGARRTSSVFDRLKGSMRRKPSLQSIGRKKSGSFGESVLGSRNQSRNDLTRSTSYGNLLNGSRSASYGNTLNGSPNQPSTPSTATPLTTTSSMPFKLDVDTSSWREEIKWPTEIIPEEELKKT